MPARRTFHQFPDLPPELRLEIWESAVRPHQHGVHFFSVYNSFNDGNSLKNLAVADNEDEEPFGRLLAAPKVQRSKGQKFSWKHGNSSTYIRDSGLWTACWESRVVIQKHYAKLNGGEFEMSSFRCNDERWKFALFPKQDLICLQPFRTKSLVNFAYPPDIPMSLHRDGWNQFSNIALEYDPSWMDIDPSLTQRQILEEDSPRGFFLRTLHAITVTWTPGKPGIWLIDYSLRRNRCLDFSKRIPLQTFFSNDQKFMEVNAMTCQWSTYTPDTALHFIHAIESDFGFTFQWFRENLDYPASNPRAPVPEPWYPNHIRAVVGLLCCEQNA